MYSTYYLFYIFFTKILVKERLHNEKDVKLKKMRPEYVQRH